VARLACQKLLKPCGLSHDTLRACEPWLDTMPSVRVRQAFVRSLHHQRETATRRGRDAVGLPLSSDPIAALFGLTKPHGVGPVKDANRLALRLPALCGGPTREEAQQVLEVTVAHQQALSNGVASLPKQRRQIRTQPHPLEQPGNGPKQGDVEGIPPGKDRSDRAPLLSLPTGDKEIKEPLPQHHEQSPTQATVGDKQVQKPVKGRTPI
jgi:hypothetical protein